MHSFDFVPRPFPPPALADVPIEYIIDQLHRLAPHYWSKPETADCTVVVPLPYDDSSRSKPINTHPFNDVPEFLEDPFNARGSSAHAQPTDPRPAPRMSMKLHMDYLCAHSTLLRGLLGGASSFDLLNNAPSPSLRPSSRHPAPAPALPALLPSAPTHPIIFLPVPDPRSLRLLVHFTYFGSTAFIEDALDRGELAWDGIARNVEYLGMGADVKVFLGRWYARWKRGREHAAAEEEDESGSGSGSEDECYDERLWDSDEDGMDTDEDRSVSTATTLFEAGEMDVVGPKLCAHADAGEGEPQRGRQRTPRRLGHSASDPHFAHTRRTALTVPATVSPRASSK